MARCTLSKKTVWGDRLPGIIVLVVFLVLVVLIVLISGDDLASYVMSSQNGHPV